MFTIAHRLNADFCMIEVSIRAYGAQAVLRQESMRRIDRYSISARTTENLNRYVSVLLTEIMTLEYICRWIDFRCAVLGAFFLSGLAMIILYGGGSGILPGASDAGFVLAQATGFNFLNMAVVRLFNKFSTLSSPLAGQ